MATVHSANPFVLQELDQLTQLGDCILSVTNGHIAALPATATVAASAAINTVETVVATQTLAASALQVGSVYRVRVHGTCTSSVANASTFSLNFGPLGTEADALVATVGVTAAASGTTIPFFVDFEMVCRTVGATGTVAGFGILANNGVTGVSAAAVVVGATGTQTVDTTVANKLTVSYVAVAATTTCTFQLTAVTIAKA
jgi:hypothetical protein